MNTRERILAVINGNKPDRIPFYSISGLFPRGSFERELRNNGMGLIVGGNPIVTEIPHVSTIISKSKYGEEVKYHTPVGDISFERYTGRGRIATSLLNIDVKANFFIKHVRDYESLIFMIEDTNYYLDLKEFILKDDDLGGDGIMRVSGPIPSYTQAELLMGLEKWSYEQYDHPEEFNRLLNALDKASEIHLNMLAEIDYDMLIILGDISNNIGPDTYRKYEVSHYEKAFKLLRLKGKKCGIHAHASKLKRHKDWLSEVSPDFIESYTPPPYSDLPLDELREAIGDEVVIIINFPETIFYKGYKETKEYTIELLKSDPSYKKMIGFSEMGMAGINNNEIRNIFEDGFRAITDALDEIGCY